MKDTKYIGAWFGANVYVNEDAPKEVLDELKRRLGFE